MKKDKVIRVNITIKPELHRKAVATARTMDSDFSKLVSRSLMRTIYDYKKLKRQNGNRKTGN